jgi:hypothetical protein
MATPAEADAPTPEPVAAPAPAPNRGGLRNAAIAAFLLFQLIMPLRYYLGGGGTDERFSWRMFSSVRMQKCDVRVDDILPGTAPALRGGASVKGERRKVDLEATLQIAWVGMLERNRPAVVEKFLARRCQEPDVGAVRYRRTCQETDGSRTPPLVLERDCKTGVIAARDGK